VAYCGVCGAAVPNGAHFCPSCGSPLRSADDPGKGGGPSTRTWLFLALALVLVAGAIGGGLVALAHRTGARNKHPGSAKLVAAKHAATKSPSPSPSPSASVPPSTESFASYFHDDRSGVVKIVTSTCTEGLVGTGFVIGRHLVATVAHVVSGEASMVIKSGSTAYTGQVIGLDAQSDVALIRTDQPVLGHIFHFATARPAVGDELAVMGYPLGGPLSFSSGSVSGLNRHENIEGIERTGLLQTDAAINPGNSGGPLLSTQGLVEGLVDAQTTNAEGLGYAVSVKAAEPLLEGWEQTPAPPSPSPCAPPSTGTFPNAALNATNVVTAFFNAINESNWPRVWALGGDNLSPTYTSMVAGYAHTEDDTALIYKVAGQTVSVGLLAQETSGVAQFYLGQYTVSRGTIVTGHQSLQETDNGTGYSRFAGSWTGHGRYMMINTGGLAIIGYRTYQNCNASRTSGCDQTIGNNLIDGGLTAFQLGSASTSHSTGTFIFSTTGLTGPVSVRPGAHPGTLVVPQFTSVPFCDEGAESSGVCGA
jgi:serine protease Do